MRQLLTLSAAVLALSMASASADTECPAKLVGHALHIAAPDRRQPLGSQGGQQVQAP